MKFAITTTPNPVKFAPIVFCGSVAEAFKAASTYGYNGVEIHLREPGDINRKEVLALMRNTGLAATTIGTGIAAVEYGINFTHPDRAMRERAVKHIEAFVDLAGQLESCITIGLMTGKIGWGEDRQERRKMAVENINRCATTASGAGVTILLEPLNRYECDFLNTVQDVIEVIRETESSNIKVLADTYHMNIEEVDIAEQLCRNVDSIGYIHLADSNRHRPGMGHVRFPEIIESLRQAGYQGYGSFECLPIPDPVSVASESIQYVKDL